MRTVSMFVGVAIVVGMIGCTTRSPAPTPMSLEAMWKIDDPNTCKEAGGKWGPHGMTFTPGCSIPLPDAGKACTDKHDCFGWCIASIDGHQYRNVEIEDIKPTHGQCQAKSDLFGCFIEFRDGKRQPAICYD
jgi:hypothetical protein